jgi:hypothetical protein
MAKDGKVNVYLPSLVQGSAAPTVSRNGVWEGNSGDSFLELLVHSMPPGANLHLADLVSLPHVWGQTHAFTIAWRDTDHPMHKSVRGEWRGLLALIGLAGWEDWPVSVVGVNFDDLAEKPFRTSSNSHDDSEDGQPRRANFPYVVRHYLPDRRAVGAADWKHSAVILYDRNAVKRPNRSSDARSVGFCAPHSLVVPARSYRHVLDDRIPWKSDKQGGYPLNDPLDCSGKCVLSRIQREVLWLYLGEVHRRVLEGARDRQGNGSDAVGFLIRMIESYQRDIEQARDTQRMDRPTETDLLEGWDTERFGGFSAPYFDALAAVPRRPKERVAKETVIPCTRKEGAAFKGVILFGDSLVRAPGLTARDILVWGSQTLEDMGNSPMYFGKQNESSLPSPNRKAQLTAQEEARRRVSDDARAQGYLLIHVEELFYPEILRMKATPVGHHGSWDGWLPPLRPLALALFTPEYLRNHLTIEDVGGKVRVTVRLDDIPDVGPGLSKRIDKLYDKSPSITEPPAVLALWPDFHSPEWHNYGLFHLRDNDRELNAAPIPATDDWLPAFVAAWTNGDDIVQFFETLPSNNKFVTRAQSQGRDRNYGAYWYKRCPEVVIGTANGLEPRRQGLILLNNGAPIPATGRGAIIGLDIGSTNSAAAWFLPGINHGDGFKRQVTFEPMLNFVFSPTNQHRQRLEAEFGLPAQAQTTPYLSLLNERKGDHGPVSGVPNVHYRVPWPLLNHRDLPRLAQDASRKEVYICDLKWAQRNHRTDIHLDYIKQYLALVMRTIGAGVVRQGLSLRTTEWRFSYPDTFTTAEVESFREIIGKLTHNLSREAPQSDGGPATQYLNVFARKECECVCAYFMQQPGSIAQSNTVIIFDVGGHNTDVVIWHRNEIKWNATLALASQATLIDFLMNKNDILNSIFPDEWQAYRDIVRSDVDPTFKRMVTELLIQDKAFIAWQDQAHEPQRDIGRIAQLRDLATFTLAGLLYYTAIALAQTTLEDTENPLPKSDLSLQLCFAGRGSQLFSKFINNSLHKELTAWFVGHINERSDGDNDRKWIHPPMVFNKYPKHEVSEGLLLLDDPAYVATVPSESPASAYIGRKPLYLGEDIKKSQDVIKAYNAYLDVNGLKETGFEIPSLGQFTKFLKSFERFETSLLKKEGTGENRYDRFVERVLSMTRNDFDRECQLAREDLRRHHRNGVSRTYQPQPVFILALRNAIYLLNRQET